MFLRWSVQPKKLAADPGSERTQQVPTAAVPVAVMQVGGGGVGQGFGVYGIELWDSTNGAENKA